MFSSIALAALVSAQAAILVRAIPSPSSPAPNDVFLEGQPCTINWDVDPTGTWKKMAIQLMTGDNFNMVPLTTVGTVDGTDPTTNSFSYTCPKVNPHSPIYFYQFSDAATSSNFTWTGRFTITDSAANIVPPTNPTQPDGSKIPWGTGALVGASGSTSTSSTSASSSMSSTTPSTTSAVASTTPGTSVVKTVVGTTSIPVDATGATILATSMTQAKSTAATPTSSPNSAVGLTSVKGLLIQTGVVLGVSALGFSILL